MKEVQPGTADGADLFSSHGRACIPARGGVPLFGEPLQQNIVVSKAVAFGFF